MNTDPAQFTHPAWKTAGGTVAGYLVILAIMTAVLFGLPWLLFASL